MDVLSGVTLLASAAVALFFLRFWRTSGDRLFAFFALAFLFFAAGRLALVIVDDEAESRHYVYLLRLVAFLLIATAIVDKNRSRP